ncbi:MAG: CopD family protein [Hyphomicrobiales bacterium]
MTLIDKAEVVAVTGSCPRLFVYHSELPARSEARGIFVTMERRLLKAIMLPAMLASWAFGLWIATLLGGGANSVQPSLPIFDKSIGKIADATRDASMSMLHRNMVRGAQPP